MTMPVSRVGLLAASRLPAIEAKNSSEPSGKAAEWARPARCSIATASRTLSVESIRKSTSSPPPVAKPVFQLAKPPAGIAVPNGILSPNSRSLASHNPAVEIEVDPELCNSTQSMSPWMS